MNLWFDPASWRKRAAISAHKSHCAPRDTATVATGMTQDIPSETGNRGGFATARHAEGASVATVAMSRDMASAETDMPLHHDVLERAAILEFCEGLTRGDADALALAEFGYASWESLDHRRGDVTAPSTDEGPR